LSSIDPFVVWVIVYNASLILAVPSPVFVLEQKINRFTFAGKVLSFFTSWTHGTIFNGIRQVAPTAQERATVTRWDSSQQL